MTGADRSAVRVPAPGPAIRSVDDRLDGVPLVESPFFADHLKDLSPAHAAIATDLHRDGYAVFDFPDPSLAEKIDGIRRDLQSKYDWAAWRAGTLDSLRVQDAWRTDPRVRDIAVNPAVLEMLTAIYGRQAFPFQTLNFPVGTQQPAHADYVHFNSVPDRFMCGVWLAFEDIDESNGPLFYYPGSHRWPILQNEHLGLSHRQIAEGYPHYPKYAALWLRMAESAGVEPKAFKAKKGQALIWAANLVHGGSLQSDPARTRWSQVTHYFFEDCAYTTPLANDVYNGRILYRTVVDVRTGEPVPNRVSGEAVGRAPAAASDPAAHPTKMPAGVPADFDPAYYLAANPDLVSAGVDPYQHYAAHGKNEGRRYKAD